MEWGKEGITLREATESLDRFRTKKLERNYLKGRQPGKLQKWTYKSH